MKVKELTEIARLKAEIEGLQRSLALAHDAIRDLQSAHKEQLDELRAEHEREIARWERLASTPKTTSTQEPELFDEEDFAVDRAFADAFARIHGRQNIDLIAPRGAKIAT